MASWLGSCQQSGRTRHSCIGYMPRRKADGGIEGISRARLWGLGVLRGLGFTLDTMQSHECLDLSADMRLARTRLTQETGQIAEAMRLKTGVGPTGSHCCDPGRAGRPQLGRARSSLVRLCPVASWVQFLWIILRPALDGLPG